MSVLIVLIIASIVVAGSFLVAFIWAVKGGQFDDTYSPSVRILFEERNAEQRAKTGSQPEIRKSKAVKT